MVQLYFKIAVREGKLEYHTGTDKNDVARFKSMNHRVTIGDSTPERIAELVDEWMAEASLYSMIPVS